MRNPLYEISQYILPESEERRHRSSEDGPRGDKTQSRFYAHYGAGSQRRSTNMYRDGNRKGRNRKTSKAQRSSELTRILSSKKDRR